MTHDAIMRMAIEAGFQRDMFGRGIWDSEEFYRFAALVAVEKEQQMIRDGWRELIRDGWRQCAKGQRTTQYCGLLDAAVKAEREACAKVAEDGLIGHTIAIAIRARSET